MIYKKLSRRMFLNGTKNTMMMIPFLPSLLSKEAFAQVCAGKNPIRFLSLCNNWSPRPDQFLNGLEANNRISPDVAVRSLAGLSNISPIIGSGFNSVLNKMSIIRGIDLYAGSDVIPHNFTFGLTACPNTWFGDANSGNEPPILRMSSVDIILKNSKQMYPTAFNSGRKHISLLPFRDWAVWENNANGSWENGSKPQTLIYTNELYNLFMNDLTGGTVQTPGGSAPAGYNPDLDIINSIFEDYKATSSSPKLSADDKKRLNQFMDLVSDIQRGVASVSTPTPVPSTIVRSCNKVAFNAGQEEGNHDKRIENQLNIIVAAMACDLTRIMTMSTNLFDSVGSQYGTGYDYHIFHHNLSSNQDEVNRNSGMFAGFHSHYIRAGQQVAQLLQKMNAIQESDGTLLDNSIVYWWNMLGLTYNSGAPHQDVDMGCVVAGGGNGALQMGHLIDYRHQTERLNSNSNGRNNGRAPGYPVNQLLLTFLNAYGVAPSEYERAGRAGYGVYHNEAGGYPLNIPDGLSQAMKNKLLSDAGKRANLPFLFKRKIC